MAYPSPTAGLFNSPVFQTFLGNHPGFAAAARQGRAATAAFLDKHPDIAKRYMALVQPPAKPAAPAGGAAAPASGGGGSAAAPGDLTAGALVSQFLAQYGLGAIGQKAWQRYLETGSAEQVFQEIRSGADWTGGVYAQRFPGMNELRAKGRAISEQEWIAKETAYAQTLRAYGLPANTYDDPNDFARLITGEVSPQEFDQRLAMREQVVGSSPLAAKMRDALARDQGLTNANGLTLAYWINPDVGMDVIKKQVLSAQASAASEITGFGTLTKAQAEAVGGYGLTADQEMSTFGQLASLKELRTSLVGDAGSQALSTDDLLAAGFSNDQGAKDKVTKESRRRQAAFEGGGGFAAGRSGVTGLGSAS